MAKPKSAPKKNTPTFKPRKGRCRPFLGSIFFVLGLLLLVALADFRPEQDFVNDTDPSEENLVGIFGAGTASYAFYFFGGAIWLAPIACFWLTWLSFLRDSIIGPSKALALVAGLISASGLLAMQEAFFVTEGIYHKPGGLIGFLLYEELLKYNLGIFGSGLVMGLIYLIAFSLFLTGNVGHAFENLSAKVSSWRGEWSKMTAERRVEKQRKKEEHIKARAKEREEKQKAKQKAREEKAAQKEQQKTRNEDSDTRLPSPLKGFALEKNSTAEGGPRGPGQQKFKDIPPPPKPKRLKLFPEKGPEPEASQKPGAAAKSELKIVETTAPKKARSHLPDRKDDHIFPSLDLLAAAEPASQKNRENHEETAEALIQTLSTFGVKATIDEVHVGPVITRFDILPAPGTKVSKIQNLENDIAMGLKAMAVRILAPVPGKGCVGVEIPNKKPQPVCLREIIESQDWEQSRAEIPIGLGKDVSGKPLIADLTKMPHLLIAGSTGSGKTVCINSIIASLLYHASPKDLRFIMVDPKIVEMKVFNDLPHMLIPVVTEPKKVPGALKWLINEMERRYRIFAKAGVRNISGFNSHRNKVAQKKSEEMEKQDRESDSPPPSEFYTPETADEEIEIPEKLPYIVCIIDELADLMMVAPADIETGIARLAQLARAAGIHLILATQRPSVNVITGVIKANLPSRISFKVASGVDSRTILDAKGADQLIGRGDMLFLPPGSSRLIRSQGAFVSDDEINDIVEALKENGPPAFEEEVQRQIEEPEDDEAIGGGGGDEDDLFEKALDVLRTTKRASTSMLQRRLRIGYNRAARLMEDMEKQGIVGPENGSSPREIYKDLDSY